MQAAQRDHRATGGRRRERGPAVATGAQDLDVVRDVAVGHVTHVAATAVGEVGEVAREVAPVGGGRVVADAALDAEVGEVVAEQLRQGGGDLGAGVVAEGPPVTTGGTGRRRRPRTRS
ncbi:hypothetical protein GCM10025875_11760 [Litorihabitans aurantiacus]|uniref:Uncharacterized protein n=1 Tax=Litorihabitans aurantiacus TaxID=1930061 RepID=A0AA37XBK5_9MICO|nr:hypothetical protein GCM10025875_11760 [Litorihabitans aurantiacus]